MKITAFRSASGFGVLSLIVGMAALLSSCSSSAQSSQPRPIKIDGSSTVYPVTNWVASEFQAAQAKDNNKNKTKIEVAFSGTGGGFRKFCAGATDISDASRPILKDAMEVCNKNNLRYVELPVAFNFPEEWMMQKVFQDWRFDDPEGQSIETFRRVRDKIKRRVERLPLLLHKSLVAR